MQAGRAQFRVHSETRMNVREFHLRISSDSGLKRLIEPHLKRLVGRPPASGIQVRAV